CRRRCRRRPHWPRRATPSCWRRERPASTSSVPTPSAARLSPPPSGLWRRNDVSVTKGEHMTTNVTSIARIRTAARVRAERVRSNSRTSRVLLLVAVGLVVIGLGETMSASSTVGIDQAADRFHFFKRPLIGVGIGLVAMLVASRVPYRFYRRAALPLYLVTLVALVAVLIMGTTRGGA